MPSEDKAPSQIEVGETMFDHANVNRMNDVHPTTVNNEHDIYGNRNRVEIEIRKCDSHIISLLAQGASGDLDDETAMIIQAANYTADGAIDRSIGGFTALLPVTAHEYYVEQKTAPRQGGWLRNPFKKKEEPTQGGVAQR